MSKETLAKTIREIPDFPIPGILFYDVTTLFKNPSALQELSDTLYEMYKDKGITKVVGIESRGFIMGPILATRLGAGFVPMRKPGKLPAETIEESYDKEYGKDTVQIHKDAIEPDDVVLLHDDLLATGGTMEAACKLVKKLNPKKVYVNFIIELKELNGKSLFGDEKTLKTVEKDVRLNKGANQLDIEYDMDESFELWDEFNPFLYELSVILDTKYGKDELKETFGLRELGTEGTQITVNGRPVFFRGTLECCIFPKTGFPPTEEVEWSRIMKICKSYGLNHIRFHSWCPPEAAFNAADKLGMYLYVECGSWADDIGSGKAIDEFIMEESERIVREYGNHPSFCLLSYGNEPRGEKHVEYLRNFVKHWKGRDNRFLYTTASGWPAVDESDWHCLPAPRIQGWNQGLKSIINSKRPNSLYDWTHKISKKKPTISHEIGQWCVYPDLKERSAYTGVFKAKNFDIFEDRLRDNGLLNLADSFLLASGKLQTLCYKADIEAALRTKDFAGFQLLDLHDFPGQGTALVGVLNPFWESKGYVTPQEYSEFCNQVVPLARLPKFIYNLGDT